MAGRYGGGIFRVPAGVILLRLRRKMRREKKSEKERAARTVRYNENRIIKVSGQVKSILRHLCSQIVLFTLADARTRARAYFLIVVTFTNPGRVNLYKYGHVRTHYTRHHTRECSLAIIFGHFPFVRPRSLGGTHAANINRRVYVVVFSPERTRIDVVSKRRR